MNERKLRQRTVDSVIEEISKYKLKNIAFHADTATANKKWIYEFCEKVEKLPFKVRIVTNSRVDTVDPDMLQTMADAGFWMICFGVESGNEEVLKANKKEATIAQAEQAVRWAKKAGLKVWTYMMLGMYKDTEDTMNETIDFACKLDGDICNFAVSAPYPGTEWGRIAESEGWMVDKRWEAYDQNYSAQVSQPGCTPDLVRRMQRKAYLKWYVSLRGVKFLLNSIKPEYFSYFIKTIRDHLK